MLMMKLALRMGRTLAELSRTMTSRELSLWIEFDQLSPIGDERGDWNAANVVATVANVHRTRGQAVKLSDAVLRFKPQEADPAVMFDRIKAALSVWQGKT